VTQPVVKSTKTTDDGLEIWNLLQDELPTERKPVNKPAAAADRDFQRQDDEVPF
jgi:hypothetical protein